KLSGNEKIWYATSFEIYQYITAQRSLIISIDETVVYNPTSIPVWIEKDKKQIIYIPAGETVIIGGKEF
ncbi:MAG: polysaccharide deacetylase, partial [Lachnospiraceae bacterium]|nr:polysaccharide deacetylase [Lachnospiraceae bacterium]